MPLKKMLCGLFIFTLFGCDDRDYLADINIQLITWTDKAHCFGVRKPGISFPWDIQQVEGQTPDSVKTQQTLENLVALGLIATQTLAYENSKTLTINRYILTTKGRKYWQQKTSSFCFGSIKAIKTTGTEDVKAWFAGGPGSKGKKIDYDYQIENVPAWARKDIFYQIYDIQPLYYNGHTHSATAIYDKERARYLTLRYAGLAEIGYPRMFWPKNLQ
ncbi:hypothetical protein [Klebsiella spallanzanii]|uniref:hypothetical protein n=1 Tax=Klebsiella spallanzanii TaxID=2587528 RepID=UPI00115ABCA5|nr:hypothetical protein [Klebsiella spallanzanii]VUS22159.1 hypothetical protein SB6419_00086 [Klebsiella spallanzanii]